MGDLGVLGTFMVVGGIILGLVIICTIFYGD